ncbi:Uncharacterised protein [Nocardia brasiliensis]|nr:Uncharacterised protein [Nocardia brasiliensis]
MKKCLLIWWRRVHRWLVHELARPRGQRLVRPLLGFALLLALVIGGLCALSPKRAEPVPARWTVCLPVIVQPPPTTAGSNHAACP